MECEIKEQPRSAVLGMKVISISEGLELGQVKLVVLTPEQRITGFTVSRRRGREERFLPLPAVSSFGQDRITVERQDLLQPVNSFARQDRRREPLSLVGCRVFTAGGRVLGRVEEYFFAVADGSITGLEVSNGPLRERLRLPGSCIIALSPQTVMIRDQGLEEAAAREGALRSGISAALDTVGGAASALAGSTRQGAKLLADNLNRRREQPDGVTAVQSGDDGANTAAGSDIGPAAEVAADQPVREDA